MRQSHSPRGNVVPMAPQPKRSVKSQAPTLWLARTRNLLLFGCILWALWTYFFVQLPNLRKLESAKVQISTELASMQQEKAALQKQVTDLGNDDYIERLARSRYNMIKPGDVLYEPTSN